MVKSSLTTRQLSSELVLRFILPMLIHHMNAVVMRTVTEFYGALFPKSKLLKSWAIASWFKLIGIWIPDHLNVLTGIHQSRSSCLIYVIKFVQVISCNLPYKKCRKTDNFKPPISYILLPPFTYYFQHLWTQIKKVIISATNDVIILHTIYLQIDDLLHFLNMLNTYSPIFSV